MAGERLSAQLQMDYGICKFILEQRGPIGDAVELSTILFLSDLKIGSITKK